MLLISHMRDVRWMDASRARLVEVGDAERRRIERNLHDGAQQRLVATSLSVRLADTPVRQTIAPGAAGGTA